MGGDQEKAKLPAGCGIHRSVDGSGHGQLKISFRKTTSPDASSPHLSGTLIQASPASGPLLRKPPSSLPPSRWSSSQAGVRSGTETVGGHVALGCHCHPGPAATEPPGPHRVPGPDEKPKHNRKFLPGTPSKTVPLKARPAVHCHTCGPPDTTYPGTK